MTQSKEDTPKFQLPGEPAGTGGVETATDVPREMDAATHSEAPWSPEKHGSTATTPEGQPDIAELIKVAWEYSYALEELRMKASEG